MPDTAEMLTCRIFYDEAIYVEGLCQREDRPLTSGIWREDGQVGLFSDGMTVSSVSMDGNGICCVMNGASGQTGIIYRCGESYQMPADYASMGDNPTVVIDGILHVGLSSLDGKHPIIWKDGETTPLKLNGYISTISTNRDF